MKFLNSFFSDAVAEFKQIKWPNKKETIRLVIIVIVFSISMAVFLGIADYGFSAAIHKFILKI